MESAMFESPCRDVQMDGAVVVRCKPRFQLSAYIEYDNVKLLANQPDGAHRVRPTIIAQDSGGS